VAGNSTERESTHKIDNRSSNLVAGWQGSHRLFGSDSGECAQCATYKNGEHHPNLHIQRLVAWYIF
jgi:hypothetical protein